MKPELHYFTFFKVFMYIVENPKINSKKFVSVSAQIFTFSSNFFSYKTSFTKLIYSKIHVKFTSVVKLQISIPLEEQNDQIMNL